MAVYRKIETSFWQDPFILELDPEEKYFYLYLMTNTKTSQCGIYEISKAVMQMELGLNKNRIDELIKKFVEHKKIIYSEETHEVMILNWIKYNGSTSHTVLKRVETELKEIKNKSLIIEYVERARAENIPIDTISIPYQYPIGTIESEKEDKIEGMAKNTQSDTVPIPYAYPIDTEKQKEEEETKEKEEVKEEEEEGKQSSSSSNKNSNNEFGEIAKLYQQVIGQPNAFTSEWIDDLLEEYGFTWTKNAMLESEKRGKRTKKYVEGILQNWKTEGGMKLGGESGGANEKGSKQNTGKGNKFTEEDAKRAGVISL